MLSDRAVALARRTGDRGARLRAEALALFASNRLGRGVATTGRALAAVRDAEATGAGEVLTRLRIELGWCAVSAGSHEVAVRVLRRELARDRIEPAVRAHALLALAAALPAQQDVYERSQVLDEAERLYADCDDSQDSTRVLKARVWGARAGHYRRLGEFGEAVAATDTGLELLRRLSDPEAEGGEIQTRLLLERVHALLDQGHRVEAVETSQAVLAEPVRAASAGPTGWLGLALATRVHLPAGDHDAALRVLAETAAISERHKLDGLLAEALNALSRAHERVEEIAEALQALRGAYSADRRWRSLVHNARVNLLTAYPAEAEAPRGRRAKPTVAAVPDPAPAVEVSAGTPPTRAPEPVRGAAHSAVTRTDGQELTAAAHASGEEVPVRTSPSRISVPEPAHSVVTSAYGQDPAAHAQAEAPVEASRAPEVESDPLPDRSAEVASASRYGRRDAGRRGSYAEAHDAARLLMEALTSRAAKETEEPAQVEETPAADRSAPEPRVAFDAASPSEMFGAGSAEEPAQPEPEDEPADQRSAGTWWPAGEPERDSADDESAGYEDDDGEDDLAQRWSGDPLAAAADSLRRITEAHGRRERAPEPVTPPHGFPPPEADELPPPPAEPEEQGGRRSKGKSLAEIRAELKLPADHKPSRRRARHADPDPLAAFQPEPAGPEPEGREAPARSAEDTDPSFRFAVPEPEPQPEQEPVPPEPSPDASLADLLADALMAYNAGRTDEAKQQVSEGIAAVGYGGRHKPGYGEPGYGDSYSDSDSEHIDHNTVGETGRNRHQSTEDDQHEGFGARHRAPGFGSAAADPLF
ncbi:hypothetical protein [Saccharopolyspora mangrovi]|uniref:Tetratricopeptide repeat protein n=1 Tax=Saccharopolyspora mangrovi TaxID=3082379 RepID=A0ABU6A929_9PSEU|nr:hypothetical protein [Saccharopolyspora sp. S2-29]MEB3368015.1 hypothetical protein [Saccharopolyspora sp. S2-29]